MKHRANIWHRYHLAWNQLHIEHEENEDMTVGHTCDSNQHLIVTTDLADLFQWMGRLKMTDGQTNRPRMTDGRIEKTLTTATINPQRNFCIQHNRCRTKCKTTSWLMAVALVADFYDLAHWKPMMMNKPRPFVWLWHAFCLFGIQTVRLNKKMQSHTITQ